MEWKKRMNKYKIVALFGEAGTGKTYIQKQMINTNFGKKYLSQIISSTTRPPRVGERDGVEYHFIPTPAQFLNEENVSKWIEFTRFRDWWYGTSIDSLSTEKINIGVFNITGIESLLRNPAIDCLPIRVKTYDKLRLFRQLSREANPDCHEICRRFITDSQDFNHINFEYKILTNDSNETNPVLEDLRNYIIDKWSIIEK